MAGPGAVTAALRSGDELLLQVQLPPTGRASDNIAQLKQETMSFMTSYMQAQKMDTEEVDLLEEVVSDGEGEGSGRAGKKGGGKGKKRKPSTD
ncbi:hypothetical protein COHA_004007 [Chlorella ohadii]|uniref:Uncharacterized protein n=1 Tax=Chlorella ohadii TaxID=2649997 RepID=A0AAD5DU06_9CHLO|nr:hypothetical protein COHA_004007 [Chlorella ohadii]